MSENEKGGMSCTNLCWIAGALLGLASYLILKISLGMSLVLALILALVVLVAVALVLKMMFCADEPMASTPAKPVAKPANPAVLEDEAADAVERAREAEAAKEAAEAEAAARLAVNEVDGVQDELVEVEAEAKARDAELAAAEAKAEAEAKVAAAKAAEEAAAKPDHEKGGESEGTKPAGLDAPRGGKADNLKEIKGVGPALEKLLNELGYYHFDQIAVWNAEEVAWVDANLKGFKGRVTRDDWVAQAKILAAGGETEFSKRVEDGDVY